MNYIIGAISSNYNIDDIKNWTLSAKQLNDVSIVLLCYNFTGNEHIIKFLRDNDITILSPENDFLGNSVLEFETDTGKINCENSYNLIHNIRFLHLWQFLQDLDDDDNIIVTDVKDIIFNKNPFLEVQIEDNTLYYKSEIVKYSEERWNEEHLKINCGLVGLDMLNEEVNNVGCWMSRVSLAKYVSKMIYMLSIGRYKVADQTAFNFIIYNDRSFNKVNLDKLAIHLHVIINGKTQYNLKDFRLEDYCIVHQYDRDINLKRKYDEKYKI